jgi:thiopurine S-methyltransferase
LVALPADARPAYAAHTNSLLTRDAEQLVVALEYDEQIAEGPPFSITADELLDYWPGLVCCDEHDDIANAPPKFIDAGLSELIERVWRSP